MSPLVAEKNESAFNRGIIVIALSLVFAASLSFAVCLTASERAEAATTYDLSKGVLQLSENNFTYTGKEIEPDVSVTLNGSTVRSWYYDVTYTNNLNAGIATVTVTPDPYYARYYGYTGSLSQTFTINPKQIASSSCYVENAYYTGKKRTPYISVYDGNSLIQGQDYTVKISGKHKKIGKYTVTLNFFGNYTGTVKKKFKILPKTPTIKKTKTVSTSSISARWSKVKGASGYKVYRYNAKKSKYSLYTTTKKTSCNIRKAGSYDQRVSFYVRAYKNVGKKTYYCDYQAYGSEYVKLSKAVFSLKRTDFGRFEIRFKSSGNYQVQICSNKKFKTAVYPEFRREWKGWTETLTCYKYTSGEKVYVRARGYYYKDGVLKVGPWSRIKAVTPY